MTDSKVAVQEWIIRFDGSISHKQTEIDQFIPDNQIARPLVVDQQDSNKT